MSDLVDSAPRSLTMRVVGNARSALDNCCDSCYVDPREKSWLYADLLLILNGSNRGEVPWALRFCCCQEVVVFEAALRAKLENVTP